LLIQKSAIVPPEFLILKKLISSQLDVDRADYLLRDSHHCGVEYGNFDYLRLFEMLRIVEGSEGGLELAVERGGVHSLEALILARYYMFAQVYFHKVRRIYDLYLLEYMRYWAHGKFSKNLLDAVRYDDQDVHAVLRRDSENGSRRREVLASRIRSRKHHRVVFETGDCAEALDKRDIGILKRNWNSASTILSLFSIPKRKAQSTNSMLLGMKTLVRNLKFSHDMEHTRSQKSLPSSPNFLGNSQFIEFIPRESSKN